MITEITIENTRSYKKLKNALQIHSSLMITSLTWMSEKLGAWMHGTVKRHI